MPYEAYGCRAAKLAGGLAALGVGAGTKLAILAANRHEHLLLDSAAMLLRATPFTIYSTSSDDQIRHVIDHSGATVLAVDDATVLERVWSIRDDLASLRDVVVMAGAVDHGDSRCVRFGDLGEAAPIDLERAAAEVRPDDLATLVYTSGTTGPPKAAMLSHRSVSAVAQSMATNFGGDDFVGKRVLSYMPLAHVADRFNSHYLAHLLRYEVTCCPVLDELMTHLVAARPQYFFGPPRIWEKLWHGFQALAENEPDEGARTRLQEMLAVGADVVTARGGDATAPVGDELAARYEQYSSERSALLARVGLDTLEIAITAAAALPRSVLDGLASIGVSLSDMYGMTEFVTGTGSPRDHRIGTVGRPFPGTEMRTADDGEIELRGPHAFVGYLHDPEATSATMTSDGFIRTGDLGAIDADGYLRLVGRKKELLITSGGKNVSPAPIENAILEHPLAGNTMVVGDGRPYLVALVVLDPLSTPAWAATHGVDGDPDVLAKDPSVRAELQRHIDEVNGRFSRPEQIKAFALVGDTWLPNSPLLTPTMKVKRAAVQQQYAATLADLYSD